MSAKVDVLEVLKDIDLELQVFGYIDTIERFKQARAAIAELIAAARNVNEFPKLCPCEPSNEEVHAWLRLTAALAAVGGEGQG